MLLSDQLQQSKSELSRSLRKVSDRVTKQHHESNDHLNISLKESTIDSKSSTESLDLAKHSSIASLNSTKRNQRSKSVDLYSHIVRTSNRIKHRLSKRHSPLPSSPTPPPRPPQPQVTLFNRNSLIFNPSRRKSFDLGPNSNNNNIVINNGKELTIGKAASANIAAPTGKDIHIKLDKQLAPWEYSIFKYNPLHYDSSDFSDNKQQSSKISSARAGKKY